MFAYPPAPPAINSFGGEVSNVDEVRRARVDPCGSLTLTMLQGKTPAEMQQVVMNMISTQGIPQTQ